MNVQWNWNINNSSGNLMNIDVNISFIIPPAECTYEMCIVYFYYPLWNDTVLTQLKIV
jgi:hypothetical protein